MSVLLRTASSHKGISAQAACIARCPEIRAPWHKAPVSVGNPALEATWPHLHLRNLLPRSSRLRREGHQLRGH